MLGENARPEVSFDDVQMLVMPPSCRGMFRRTPRQASHCLLSVRLRLAGRLVVLSEVAVVAVLVAVCLWVSVQDWVTLVGEVQPAVTLLVELR